MDNAFARFGSQGMSRQGDLLSLTQGLGMQKRKAALPYRRYLRIIRMSMRMKGDVYDDWMLR